MNKVFKKTKKFIEKVKKGKHIKKKKKEIILAVIIILSFAIGFFSNSFYRKVQDQAYLRSNYIQFINDVYSTIESNYWQKMPDKDLLSLFQEGIEKLTGQNILTKITDKKELDKDIYKIITKKTKDNKEKFVSQLANIVLVNLKPFGRSSLYNQKKEVELVEKVDNINQSTGKKEPTISAKLFTYQQNSKEKELSLPANVAYIKISRISPDTFADFKKEAKKLSQENKKADSLIIDLRGNIGGSFDLLPYFLGAFIGQDQYAFELYHQGKKIPFKTKTGFLPSLFQYKKVVILVDGKTQSSAELMASVLKRYNVGVVLGTQTRGWGTIERVFPIKHQISAKNKYSIFLVHSLSLRDDNLPIEGRGVTPTININDKNWPKELFAYFGSESLIRAVKSIISKK